MLWQGRWWLAVVFLLWIVAGAWLIYNKWAAIKGLALPDTDDNMRLQQVRDWLAGQPWFDLTQHRLDPPRGGQIHWSRLVDIPLAGLMLFFKSFLAAPLADRATVAVGPLLPLGVAMVAVGAIMRRLIADKVWILGPAMLLCASMAIAMMAPLRIDHHGWQIALLLVMVAGLVTRNAAAGGAISGVALGLSLAIGIELLPYLGLTAILITLYWVADKREARRIAAFGAAAAGSTALALLLFIPPASRLLETCDALSNSHAEAITIGGAGLVLLALLPLQSLWLRLGSILALGGVVLLYTYTHHPLCLGDPSRLIDPEAQRLWLANVREARPIYTQSLLVQLGALSIPVMGAIGVLAALWWFRSDPWRLRGWLAVGALSLFGLGFCFFQTRAGPTAQALAVPGAAALAWMLITAAERIKLMPLRAALVAGAFLFASGIASIWIGQAIPSIQKADKRSARGSLQNCSRPSLLQPLNALPPSTMFTLLDLSPRLIVMTHHSAIAGPYHRNGPAIADVMKMWGGQPDQAREIVKRHHAAYLLLCPGTGEAGLYIKRAPKTGMYARLLANNPPDWLKPVQLPGLTRYRLWKVVD